MSLNYNPRDILATWGAIELTQGAQDGDFLKLTFNSDLVKSESGAKGEHVRTWMNDTLAECEITIQNASPVNDAISALVAARWAGPFMIKDLNGNSLSVSASATAKKWPDLTRGKEHGATTWVFDLGPTKVFVGGAAS